MKISKRKKRGFLAISNIRGNIEVLNNMNRFRWNIAI